MRSRESHDTPALTTRPPASQNHLIAKLQHQLEQLLRDRHGKKAEKVDPDQLLLFARDILAQAEPMSAPTQQPTPAVSKSNGHGRKRLPASLRDGGWDDARLMAARSERSKPLLESFAIWLEGEAKKVLHKSPVGEAITYTRSNWAALVGSLESPTSQSTTTKSRTRSGRSPWAVRTGCTWGATAAAGRRRCS